MKFLKFHIQRIFLLTDLLTYLLMPSDKHNSRTARARDLISSLINKHNPVADPGVSRFPRKPPFKIDLNPGG